jgi:tetratricopeptide (TPR) repeat protein
LELGENRYQDGDRVGALSVWQGIDADSAAYPEAQRRIAEVDAEFDQLIQRYLQRGRYFEEKGRLAEAVLNHRLSLRLQPDPETLAHVQQLVRILATRRMAVHDRFLERFAAGDLSGARAALQDLRELDPFWPGAVSDEQALQAAWQSEIERLLAWGRVGFDAGNLPHADRAFRDVLDLDASNETALGYLAFIDQARADGAATRTATEAEIRAEGFYRNALGMEARGDPYAAIALDLEALAADSDHRAARQHLEGIRTRLTDEVPALIEAGRRFYRREDLQAALDQWRRALLVDPNNSQARDYAQRAERLLESLERIREDPLPGVSAGPANP